MVITTAAVTTTTAATTTTTYKEKLWLRNPWVIQKGYKYFQEKAIQMFQNNENCKGTLTVYIKSVHG